ncbi:MAG: DUF1634 domain-containing protein [Polyangiaceae bacterium]|jgi:uncharacterized membrane protein
MATADEDRLLRVWTPRILRGALAASTVLLAVGLCVVAAKAPASYIAEYRALQQGRDSTPRENLSGLLGQLAHGQSRALLVAGLLMLTIVPIGRVAFTVVVFLRQRDWLFTALTALVLSLLVVGVVLGRIG